MKRSWTNHDPAGAVHPARRPALRQRQHPPGHGAEQDPQGFRRQEQVHGGFLQPLRPRLGLPRPAHRAQGRPEAGLAQKEHEPAPGPRGVPAVRRKIPRLAARRLQAPGRLRRLGQALHHPRPVLRGHGHPLFQLLRQEGQRLPQEAPGLLVPLLPDGPGRGRGRIPRPHVALDHGEIPAAPAAAFPEGIRAAAPSRS